MATVTVAAAVLVEDGKVLVTRRPRGTHLEDMWEFPGGKVEPDEDPQAALVREIKEEIGVDVRVGRVVEVTFWRYPKKNVLLLFYRVTRADRAQAVQHLQVADHAWVTAEALAGLPLPPADVPVVARVREILSVHE